MSTETELGPLVSDKTAFEATRPLVHSAIAFIVIDTLIVVAKTYSRHQIAKLRFWWDDFWIIAAYVLLMPLCALGMVMAHTEVTWNNEDRIIENVDEAEILLKIIFALLQFLVASYAATRYSILALYLRMFSDKLLRRAIWAAIGFVTLQWIAFSIASIVQCQPVRYYWDRRIEGGTCVDVDTFYRSVTPSNLFIDVVLVIMPLPTIWKLKASRGRKWGLTIVMLIGIGALIASAIRLSVYNTHSAKYLAPSYTNIMIMWLVIEPSIYLIAACLPAMHHIFAAVFPRTLADRLSRMIRLPTTMRSRSRKSGQMSLNSVTDHDNDLSLELVKGSAARGGQSSAHAARRTNESVESGLMTKGIIVTNEVTITYTQEERIERVIGF